MVCKRGSLGTLTEQCDAAPRRSLLQLGQCIWTAYHLFTGPLDGIAHGPANPWPPLPLSSFPASLLLVILPALFCINCPDTLVTVSGPFASCDKILRHKTPKKEGFGSQFEVQSIMLGPLRWLVTVPPQSSSR